MNLVLPSGFLPALLWRQIAPRNAIGVLAVCVLFGALLALGVYRAQGPALRPPAQKAGTGGPAVSADPVVRFRETRVGHLLFSSIESDECRRVLFDNRDGAQYEAGHIYCGQKPVEIQVADATSTSRMLALRRSFQK
jgi:hypothetical protein